MTATVSYCLDFDFPALQIFAIGVSVIIQNSPSYIYLSNEQSVEDLFLV